MTTARTSAAPAGPTFSLPEAKPGARERILDTARVLFYRRGVVNVGIDEVIAESGVAKATLYKHFPSKDALILEFMRQGDARWLAWLRGAVEAREPDPARRVPALFATLREWFSLPHFRGCLLTNAVTELANPEHAAGAVLADHKAHVLAYLEELARGVGALDPVGYAAQLLVLMEGATVVARTQRDPAAADRAAEMAEALLKG